MLQQRHPYAPRALASRKLTLLRNAVMKGIPIPYQGPKGYTTSLIRYGYAVRDGRRLVPTDLGRQVIERWESSKQSAHSEPLPDPDPLSPGTRVRHISDGALGRIVGPVKTAPQGVWDVEWDDGYIPYEPGYHRGSFTVVEAV